MASCSCARQFHQEAVRLFIACFKYVIASSITSWDLDHVSGNWSALNIQAPAQYHGARLG